MADLTPERWLPVPGYEGFYDVSDYGGVRSVRHMTAAGWRGGRVLSPFLDGDGYFRVNLSRYGKLLSCPVHVLVLKAFVRQPVSGEQGRHGIGGKTDNSLGNLCWGTPQENSDDKYRDGTMVRGERQGNSKLCADDVREIRRRRAAGESMAVLAREFRISQIHANRIILRQSWKHIP
jgi:NUMOD4 motif